MEVSYKNQSMKPLFKREVEWLGSNLGNSQLVDTGIFPSEDIEFHIRIRAKGRDDAKLFGCVGAGIGILYGSWRIWHAADVSQFGTSDTEFHVWEVRPGKVTIDGSVEFERQFQFKAGDKTMSAFGFATESMFYSRAEVSWFKIFKGKKLVMDAVPVVIDNENGEEEGVFFDRLTRKIMRNASGVPLEIGPDK